MKLAISRRSLAPALTALSAVVEARNTIPILSNLALEASLDGGDGRLEITSTDLDMVATVRLEAGVAVPGAVTLDAERMRRVVEKLPVEAEIEIDTTGRDGRAALRSGRARYEMPTLPIEDFPKWEAAAYPTGFDIEAAVLLEALEATQFAISTDETRYYLNGVHLHVGEGTLGARLIVVATDSHRLAKWARTAPVAAVGMPGVIVPRKSVKELTALLKGVTDPVKVGVSETRMRVAIGETTLATKLIDGTFPDYGRVIPAAPEAFYTVDRLALAASLDRIATIQSARNAAVALAFAERRLELRANDPDCGSATEEMAYDSDDAGAVTIGFNGRYLRDALAVLDGDRVEIGLTDPGTPGLFRPANPAATAADRLVVVMPMRV